MVYLLVTLVIITALGIWWRCKTITRKRKAVIAAIESARKAAITSIEPELLAAVFEFKKNLSGQEYFNWKKYEDWLQQYGNIKSVIDFDFQKLPIRSDVKAKLSRYFKYCDNGTATIKRYNGWFADREMKECAQLFDTVERYPLHIAQRLAIVKDEDNSLVIAGAGTGKTTTMVGKVAHLIARHGISPDKILILAFNRKVMREMADRLKERLAGIAPADTQFVVHTFHSFGRDVIATVKGDKPDVKFGEQQDTLSFINSIYQKLVKREEYSALLVDYLVDYLRPYKAQEAFSTHDEYIQYIKSNNIFTLKNEKLKSYEEVEIANFLFLNGIDYEYERPYEFPARDRDHRQYRPDFYLPQHKIYLEHWGIDRHGNVPPWFQKTGTMNASQFYKGKIGWARGMHMEHNTPLIETYSYEKREGVLLKNLALRLQERGMMLHRIHDDEILKHFTESRDIPLLIHLICKFLNLFKGNLYTMQEVIEKATTIDRTGRSIAFLKVFEPIYEEYEGHLKSESSIDFSDMLSMATAYIKSGRYEFPFHYILIDEFQDISKGRYSLIKSLLDQSPSTKTFCVGDDWQSIYRFTGCDLDIMTSFENYFGHTEKTYIEKTFRFNREISEISGEFIQKNPFQMAKKLQTDLIASEPSLEIIYKREQDDDKPLADVLSRINTQARKEKSKLSVLILDRYKFKAPKTLDKFVQRFNKITIDFTSVHQSKGREADYVIINNVIQDRHGFPSEMEDDPILNLVLTAPDLYENSEERRLFYVALTRGKRKVFILTEESKKSKFITEIQDKEGIRGDCPFCKGGKLIKKDGPYGTFLACSNFPYCEFTKRARYAKT